MAAVNSEIPVGREDDGMASVSVMRTGELPKLIGTLKILNQLHDRSIFSPSVKAVERGGEVVRRDGARQAPEKVESLGRDVARGPRRRQFQGLSYSPLMVRSGLLSNATTNPASTRTFLAITRGVQIMLLSCTEVGR